VTVQPIYRKNDNGNKGENFNESFMDKCFYRRGKVSLSGTILAVGIFVLIAVRGIGQTSNNSVYRLTIAEAIEFSKSQNKWVQTANMEVNAANEDSKDVIRAKLPTVFRGKKLPGI